MENFIFCAVTTRLINLTKNEIGRISKVILVKINSSLIEQLPMEITHKTLSNGLKNGRNKQSQIHSV